MQQFRVNNIKELLTLLKDKKFVIWGAGAGGYIFFKSFCEKYKLYPLFVLDKKVEKEKKFLGIKAVNPYYYKLENLDKNLWIIITIKKEWIVRDIEKFLEEREFKNIIELEYDTWFELEKNFWEALYKTTWKTKEKQKKHSKNYTINVLQNITQKVCVIHIGMPKTGSTSIQISLSNFKNDKFCYPKLDPLGNHSFPLAYIFMNYEEFIKVFNLFVKEKKENFLEKQKFYLNQLRKACENDSSSLFILSGEAICKYFENNLKYIKNFFKKYFFEIKIIAYIREPYSYISSSFQEYIKNFCVALKDLNTIYFQYQTFQKFFEVFGEKNVILKKFDSLKFPDGCVVKDFCQTLGIAIEEKRIVRANASLPKEAVNLIYILRKYFSKINFFPWQIEYLLNDLLLENILKDIALHKFKISKKLIKPIVEKHKDDIKWMEEKLEEPLINSEELEKPESKYVIKSEKDLLTIPEEVFERLRDYTNYKLNKRKSISQQVAEMLLNILADNFPDIKAQIEN